MELSKIDLSAITAIGHDYDHLGLLIDTGEHMEYVEIPAPIYAYEGLQELAEITQEYHNPDFHEPTVEITKENYPSVGESFVPGSREYYEIAQQVDFIAHQGDVYKYEKTVEVTIKESLSKIEPENPQSIVNQEVYLSAVNYEVDSQRVTMEFDDGSVYQYEQVTPEFWEDFKGKSA